MKWEVWRGIGAETIDGVGNVFGVQISLHDLNVRSRRGWSRCVSQMRWMGWSETPMALAIGTPGPVGDSPGGIGAGQGDDPSDDRGRNGRRAGLAGLVAEKAIDALLGEALLPAPDGGSTDAGAAGHFEHRQTVAGETHDLGTQYVFERAVPITDDLIEAVPIGRVQDNADGLGHDPRLAHLKRAVNLLPASTH
jgi:hypothetical protein